MRRLAALGLLGLSCCSSELYLLSQTPASIELAATRLRDDQSLADAAEQHCRQTQRDAVEVRRRYLPAMPDGLGGGRAVLYHCR
ncbi:MAG TPA: hypothetical protein VE684_01315 [Crenalkalicoccus sp.]|jgi:hypothetical protein|nr:hypothetical protein [Crenalkalicoccus sp.]